MNKIYATICLFLIIGGAYALHTQKNKTTKPNVVLFYLDDSGYGDYEHNGNPTIKTPNISKLKERGV